MSCGFLLDAQVKTFRPVTEAMLRNPAAGDWLNWRRTDNAWGYSPLDQITRQNVQNLQLAWSWSMDDTGSQQAAPLVYADIIAFILSKNRFPAGTSELGADVAALKKILITGPETPRQ